MIKQVILFSIAAISVACGSAPVAVQQNANGAPTSGTNQPQSVIAHSSESKPGDTAAAGKPKWSQSGEPIDTKAFDSAIIASERALSTKPADEKLKKIVSTAYFNRGFALTEARQYAAALGDYRKAYKLDPAKAEAKEWIDKIIKIYDGLKKEYPKEGEEPPALPFTKQPQLG